MTKSENKTYEEVVFGKANQEQISRENTLRRAWEIRNFEIELYWKRALYFWGFIALSFAGYFSHPNDIHSAFIAFAGFIFSIAWYFVNKASKFWQENWEAHIDCLEDDQEGSLYKTVLKNKTSFWHPLKGYHFSVSKINQLISVFVIIIWIVFFVIELPLGDLKRDLEVIVLTIIGILLLVLVTGIFYFSCKTTFTEDDSESFKPLKGCKYTYFDRQLDKE